LSYAATLPRGIRSRFANGINGLDMHFLEAGEQAAGRPCVLLLHGFPELAYSWRKVMPPLADAGYHVIAPDQRGYGRTTGWDARYDGDVDSFRLLNLVQDALGLVAALGYESIAGIVGHDFGSPVAAWCALMRPDVFRSVALMSAPFGGPPPPGKPAPDAIHADLAALDPPRKHYQWYYSTRGADAEMRRCPQGVHAFLRAYYHVKSADWRPNQPRELAAWTAGELARLPRYYVMDLDKGMAETVAPEMPSPGAIASNPWLTEDELRVYSSEFARTGFQGGLQWYRCRTEGRNRDLEPYAGRTIDVPACFIAGASDWGPRQKPGELAKMEARACTRMQGTRLIEGAGHWVQQEQPEAVSEALVRFLSWAGSTR
jgi:pimeloyl-ACP methyl ester carboxylesterase